MEYFAESILNPNAVIVTGPGYTGPDGLSIMPDYRESLMVSELIDLVAYLKSLKSDHEHMQMPMPGTAPHGGMPTPQGGGQPGMPTFWCTDSGDIAVVSSCLQPTQVGGWNATLPNSFDTSRVRLGLAIRRRFEVSRSTHLQA